MIYLREIRLPVLPEASYAGKIPAVRFLHETGGMKFEKPVTFLVGENGTGKSTLLEAIAVAMGFPPEGGPKEFTFSTRDTHSELSGYLKLIRTIPPEDGFFLRAESLYNAASYLDDSGSLLTRYGGRSLHGQSHGESFLAIVTNRFEGNGLYLLDEPEAALSPQRQLSLLAAVHELVKKNAQFIIATHSPILMSYPDGEIKELSERGIQTVPYRETDHYRLTRDFLNGPERMLRLLLEDGRGEGRE